MPHANDNPSSRSKGRDHTAHWVAHVPTYVFFVVESKQNGHQGNPRIASSCVQPGHPRHIYASRNSSEATSPEQRHSTSRGVYSSCGLRPTCGNVFLFCASAKRYDRREKHWLCHKVRSHCRRDLCLFCAYMKEPGKLQVTEKIWRPRRDLNPCYRRESKLQNAVIRQRSLCNAL